MTLPFQMSIDATKSARPNSSWYDLSIYRASIKMYSLSLKTKLTSSDQDYQGKVDLGVDLKL